MIPKDLVELKIKEWENENYPAIDKFHKFVFIFLVLTLFNEILISILDFILDRGKINLIVYMIEILFFFIILLPFLYGVFNSKFRLFLLENVIFELFSEYDVRKSFKHYIFSNTLEDINEIDQIWQKFNINVKSRFFIGHLNVIGFSILEFFQISFTILLIIKFL